MKTTASYEIKLKEFRVPYDVEAEELNLPPGRPDEAPCPPRAPYTFIPLHHLNSDALDTLCRNFTVSVFKAAGKEHPPLAGCDRNHYPPAPAAPHPPKEYLGDGPAPTARKPMDETQIDKLRREVCALCGSSPSGLESIVRLVEKFHGLGVPE